MVDPVRHSASLRNRRKALHHAENMLEETKHLVGEIIVIQEKLQRLVKLASKIENRLKAEIIDG
jgi:hypothetical protein